MKNQVFNPYLPSYEYIPDGEPHVFDGRVYIYGSHDKFGAHGFCVDDYVTWSAPADDLSDWRYEGIIFRRGDDPNNKRKAALYAPDVCKAPDGKYYLYFSPAPGWGKKSMYIAVAVSDKPQGPFSYHGKVDLAKWINKFVPFDPAVYVEDGRVWLYYGSGVYPPISFFISKRGVRGGAVVELDSKDMCTVIGEPKMTVPLKHTDISGEYCGHEFFEASSIRKINGRYYFIYSSRLGHELCYAIGDSPAGPFSFGGTLVSNGDIGLNEHKNPRTACNYTGNTHGSILDLNGKDFVFYHRHTNRHDFSRQGCAERLALNPDGGFQQAEITSCGLNGKPLSGCGKYSAGIACHLTSKKGARFYGVFRGFKGKEPYITQCGIGKQAEQYVANIHNGTVVGFKYFDLSDKCRVKVFYSGKCNGKLLVKTKPNGKAKAEIILKSEYKAKHIAGTEINFSDANAALYLEFQGKGSLDLYSIEFGKR